MATDLGRRYWVKFGPIYDKTLIPVPLTAAALNAVPVHGPEIIPAVCFYGKRHTRQRITWRRSHKCTEQYPLHSSDLLIMVELRSHRTPQGRRAIMAPLTEQAVFESQKRSRSLYRARPISSRSPQGKAKSPPRREGRWPADLALALPALARAAVAKQAPRLGPRTSKLNRRQGYDWDPF
jgi:hypothetical protein